MSWVKDYARAVISSHVNTPADEVDDRIAARLARRCLFSRDPHAFVVNQDEVFAKRAALLAEADGGDPGGCGGLPDQ